MNRNLFLYLEFIICGFQQYSRRVGIAHQIQGRYSVCADTLSFSLVAKALNLPVFLSSLFISAFNHCNDDFIFHLRFFAGFYNFTVIHPVFFTASRSLKLAEDEYLREIDTPLLIIGAENDRVVALDAQKNLALKLPNCKYCVIHGARHEVLMESDEF